MEIRLTRLTVAALLLVGGGFLCGCAGNGRGVELQPCPIEEPACDDAAAKAEAVRRDPVGYLRQVAAKCRTLEQYTLWFTRYERRGLFARLYGPEHIRCWFRREPFSIHMTWLDENLKYFESTYVEGEQGDKVRFVTRWWSPPLLPPPRVNKVGLYTPVTWGEAKRPLTDFGLERMMEQTLASLEAAGENVVVTYEGLVRLPGMQAAVHHLHLAYAPGQRRTPIQELYIDMATDMPVGTVLILASGRLDAAYFYEDLDADVELTDEDFLLEAEREQMEIGTDSEPQ